MKNVFIVHGAFGSPEENWIPWLTSELQKQGYIVTAPKFPTPEGQNYDNWMGVAAPHLEAFNEETVLVGHSIGATFTLCILEELSIQIAKTILVSGFIGLLDNEDFDSINHTISNRDFDWDEIQENSSEFYILHGDNDPYVPVEKAMVLSAKLQTEPILIQNGGHLNADAGFTTFPKLLKVVTN